MKMLYMLIISAVAEDVGVYTTCFSPDIINKKVFSFQQVAQIFHFRENVKRKSKTIKLAINDDSMQFSFSEAYRHQYIFHPY